MRKFILSALLIGSVFIGCEDDEDETQVQTNDNSTTKNITLEVESSSSAKMEDDNKSSGVYKGTFVGSTGSFKLTLESGKIGGILVVDGVGYDLETTDISVNDLGSAINNAIFVDKDSIVILTFSVDSNGQNPTVALTVDGHSNIQSIVAKETSALQTQIYEGFITYRYTSHSCKLHFNLMLSDKARVTYKYNSTLGSPGAGQGCDENDDGTYGSDPYAIIDTTITINGDWNDAWDLNSTGSIDASGNLNFSGTGVSASLIRKL